MFLIFFSHFFFGQVLAVPAAGRALGRALPLEAAVSPILAAQRAVLAGTDPADYPRAPVEIVLVSLTLLAQLGIELSGGGGGGGGCPEAPRCGGVAGEVGLCAPRRRSRSYPARRVAVYIGGRG